MVDLVLYCSDCVYDSGMDGLCVIMTDDSPKQLRWSALDAGDLIDGGCITSPDKYACEAVTMSNGMYC